MARQKGPIKLTGKLGSLSFYYLNGKPVARPRYGHSSERIRKDPALKNILVNTIEFAGSSTLAAAVRSAFRKSLGPMSLGYVQGRLASALRLMLSGKPGQRPYKLSMYGDRLDGFEFNSKMTFRQCFKAPLGISFDHLAHTCTLRLPAFSPRVYIKAPAGATHFALVMAMACISDMYYDKRRKKYVFKVVRGIPPAVTRWSGMFPLGKRTKTFDLHLAFGSAVPPNNTCTLVVAGLVFYQQIGHIHYPLRSGQCAQVLVSSANVPA